MDAKIISMALKSIGIGSDLKLNMLEEIQNVSKKGKPYRSVEHLSKIIKHISVKFQEESSKIRYPSLIIWIAMYHL